MYNENVTEESADRIEREEAERMESAAGENRNARNFAKYLNERMEQYSVSVAELSEQILVSKKSIYRYKNAVNPPTKEIEAEIKLYFQKLERALKEKEGIRYANEHDLSEEELELLFYELDREKIEEDTEEQVHQVVARQADAVKEGIGYYNASTQEYIIKNFEVICMIPPEDMRLVERMETLDRERFRNKVIDYLERVPMNFGMLAPDDSDGSESRIQAYIKMIQLAQTDVLKTNKYRKLKENSKGLVTQETYRRLYDKIESMFYAGTTVPADILGRIRAILDYTGDEWYFLFLYERIRKSDLINGAGEKLMIDGRSVGAEEYLFLHFLKSVLI